MFSNKTEKMDEKLRETSYWVLVKAVAGSWLLIKAGPGQRATRSVAKIPLRRESNKQRVPVNLWIKYFL
jgi:hypothetical protein